MTYLAYDKLIHFPPAPVTEPLELKARPGHQLFPLAKLGPSNHLTILQVGAAQHLHNSVMCVSGNYAWKTPKDIGNNRSQIS